MRARVLVGVCVLESVVLFFFLLLALLAFRDRGKTIKESYWKRLLFFPVYPG